MYRVGGVWTNGLRRTSTGTDATRIKLAPDVSRICIQLTPRGRSRCWAATGSKWDDESANVVFEVWTRTGSSEWKNTLQGKIRGNAEVVKSQTTGASSGVSAVRSCRYLGLRTTESRPFFIVVISFSFSIFYFMPEHNRPLAECFYTKCLTGSCVHTFLTGATGIALNPCSVRARLCPQICTVQFLPFKRRIKNCYFCLWRNVGAYKEAFGAALPLINRAHSICFSFFFLPSKCNEKKRRNEDKTKEMNQNLTWPTRRFKEGVCFLSAGTKRQNPAQDLQKKKQKNPLLNQEYKLPAIKLHLQSL